MQFSKIFWAAMTALCLVMSHGDVFAERDEIDIELPDITVTTAAGTPQATREVMASVSIISREEIRRSAAEDLLELLRLQAGVDIVRSGPAGSQTSLFLRGSNSDHVLVLIDGIRVASPHTGAYAWELLPLTQIQRVEIVRGPRASVYGSDAIGGVIQIFTRRDPGGTVRVTGGSFGSFEVEGGHGWVSDQGRHSFHGAWRRSDGFSAQNPGGFSYDPDNDGFESVSASANGEFDFVAGQLGYRILASRTDTEFDQGESQARQALGALIWSDRVSANWAYELQASYMDDELESDYGFFTSAFDAKRINIGWRNQLRLGNGDLRAGLEYLDEEGVSDGNYEARRDNRAGFANWDQAFGRAHVQLGGRFDDNSQFGSQWTWQAAVGLEVGQSGRISAQSGTSFRAPDLGELYSPGFFGFYAGNSNLEPETSETTELNYIQEWGEATQLTLSAYHTDIEQLIAFSGSNFGAVNIDKAMLRGLEAEIQYRGERWSLRANVTLQDTEDASTGMALLRRPEEKASVSIDRSFAQGAWLGMDWFASGSRLDFGGVVLPGYGLISVRGGWSLREALTAQWRVENLLDTSYEPAAGYNASGRAVFFSLDWAQ